MPIFEIRHRTSYRYRRPVRFGPHRMMLRPQESFDQHLEAFDLEISPTPSALAWSHDVFGNPLARAVFDTPGETLVIEARARVRHAPADAFFEADDADVASLPLAYGAEEAPDVGRCAERRYPDPDGVVAAFARRFLRPRGETGVRDLLIEMTRAVHGEFRYVKRHFGDPQTPAQTLTLGVGSCRDFAVLMMEASRSLGLAAQFVSGYVHTPEVARGALRQVGGGHTHAWLRVFLPKFGWVEFDPTNGIVGGRDLIRVAAVRDPRQATPLAGTFFGSAEDYLGMDVEVDVVAVDEAPEAAPRAPAVANLRRKRA